MTVLATKRFNESDQQRFAVLSGDRNPIHMDAVFARRTQHGFPIVHGVHTLLWALDALFARSKSGRPTALKASFTKPIFIGDEVRAVLIEQRPEQVKLDVTVGDVVAAKVIVAFGSSNSREYGLDAQTRPSVTTVANTPRELSFEQIPNQKGYVPYEASVRDAAAAFSAAAHTMSGEVIRELLATSYLVGMECPGLHSMLSGLSFDLMEGSNTDRLLAYRVDSVDPRFRLVSLFVYGLFISGTIDAFFRQPPVEQPSISNILELVKRDEFVGHRVLIVGGSRGLGEVTAKIVAAGGATPIITFAVGRAEAAKVATEVLSAGLQCEVMQYDVRVAAEPQLAKLMTVPTHFYYFATSPIFRRKTKLYEPEVMRDFIEFYVDGFYELCNALRLRQRDSLVGFFPSTVAIDQPVRSLIEYSTAKLAGECLCAQINAFIPRTRIVVKRLPRILTDQTATAAVAESMPPLEAMLPIVREVQSTQS